MPSMKMGRLACNLVFLGSICCVCNVYWTLHAITTIDAMALFQPCNITTNIISDVLAYSAFANEFTPSSAATSPQYPQYPQSQPPLLLGQPPRINIQSFVISLHRSNALEFLERNSVSGMSSDATTWFPASYGYEQHVLDDYAHLTRFKALNASQFSVSASKQDKRHGGYAIPHHIGCFMSHYHLLRLALDGWKVVPPHNTNTIGSTTLTHQRHQRHPRQRARPEALLVLEDDATCTEGAMDQIRRVLPQLPLDWDMLYLGGKPFTNYWEDSAESVLDPNDANTPATKPSSPSSSLSPVKNLHSLSKDTWREWACAGVFGNSSTGPFAPDGTRSLSLDQPYWKTTYITNTHAYLVNPSSLEYLLDLLEHPKESFQVPVDIAFANAMRDGRLNAYMTPQEYCVQGDWNIKQQARSKAADWTGLYFKKGWLGRRVDKIYFSECPQKA